MEKIIFFTLALPILGFVIYLGGTAIMNGFKAKVDNRPQETEENDTSDVEPNNDQLSNEIKKLNSHNEETLGDMFFCRPILKKNATEFHKGLIEELQLVLIHGLLHLVGYSHLNETKLRKKENEILDKVWNGLSKD